MEESLEDMRDRARPGSSFESQVTDGLSGGEIDLHELTGELARGDGISVVGREFDVIESAAINMEGLHELHRLRFAEVDPVTGLGDHHGGAAIGREIEVIGVADRQRCSLLSGQRIDGREAVASVVGDPQRCQVIRRNDMMRKSCRSETYAGHDTSPSRSRTRIPKANWEHRPAATRAPRSERVDRPWFARKC